MTRPLSPGLIAEGETDELFLGQLIQRQVAALTDGSPRCVASVRPLQVGECRTTSEIARITDAVRELSLECHIVFLHNDHNERSKAERVAHALAGESAHVPVVPLVPVRETEAWLLADRGAWERIRGSNPDVLPDRARDVQKIADPKAVLEAVLPKRLNHHDYHDYFDYLGHNVDLGILAQIPAYAEWIAETEKALKGLGYL